MNFDELWGRSTPNSWARVPRGPFAAAVGTFLFGSTGIMAAPIIGGISAATMVGFLITTAITSWALSALAPRPEGGSRSLLANVKEAAGPFDIVYGEVRKGGVVTFLETTDRIGYKVFKDDFLHQVIVLAGHEVEEIGDIYLNDEVVTLDANGFVTGDRWKSLIRIKKHLGAPDQVADPDLVAETSVTSDFRGRGIAYLYVRMDWDKDVFASGSPTITAKVKGRKVYDPRTGTTAWSDNAALCIRDYIAQPFGVNSAQSPNSMASNSWSIGANVCDTLVTLKGGGTEKRYTINGVVSTANTPKDNIQQMLTACGGTLFWGQGQWQFKPGYLPAAPYTQFGVDDLRGDISLVTKNSRKENFNAVTGLFVDKNQGYTQVEYPKLSSAVFLARDNGQENVLDVTLPFTVKATTAQRLAKMAMFRSREEMVISADFSLKAANVKVGDVIQFTFDRYGFSNKLFEVVTWKPVLDSGELKFNLILKETSAAAYDWNAEEKDIIGNDTTLPDPTAGLSVSNLTVTNRQTLQADGTFIGEVVLSWNEAESAFIDKYTVQWKRTTDTNWSATETDNSSIVLASVVAGLPYNYRVRAVSLAGFTGPWEQISATVTGKDTPPGVPRNFTATGAYRSVNLKWTNPTDKDLNHTEVWYNSSSSTTGRTLLGRSGGTTFIDGPVEPNVPRYYWIRAVDNSDNKSAYTAVRSANPRFVEDNDIDIDVKELLEDAGLSAVEVLGALPTTGNFVGRTVYLTTDNQIYTWDGTKWITVTNQFDGELDAQNFPANLKPVEIVTSLPTTGNFKGRVVFLTTDNKLYRHTGSPAGAAGFVSSIPAVDVTGTLTNSQIADLAATKITGEINTGQIADDAITTAKLKDLAIQAGKIANNAITETKISDDAISAPKLKANSVVADKIAAEAITASKLVLMDTSNMVTEGDFSEGGVNWSIEGGGSKNIRNISSTNIARFMLRLDPATTPGTGFTGTRSKKIPVVGDKTYHVGANVFSNGAHEAIFRVNWIYNDGTTVTQNIVPPNQNFSWAYYGNNLNAPESAVFMEVALYLRNNVGTGNYIQFANVTVRPAASAELIVDGAITSDKIQANAVTAGKILAGAVTADKILANAVTADKIQAGAVTANKIEANAVTSDKIDANAVTAGKIAAGAVAADAIRSNSIAARHLLVGDFTNLVPNADISDVPSWGIAPQWTVALAGPNFSGMYVTSAVVSSSSTGVVISEPFSVDGGAQYYASIQARVNGSGQSVQLACTIRWEDTEGNIISSSIVKSGNPPLTSVGVTTFEANVTAPTTATRGRFFWQVNGGTGTIYVGSPTVRRRNDGKLIVDGAIQANHMTANSVTAGVIAAGAINAAALFVDGVITASKLNVDSFSTTGLAIFGGTLRSNNFDLEAGTGWRIQNNGTFNIPNAVITNGKIANAAVDTLKIAGKSVTVPAFVSAQSNDIQMNYVLTGPPGETYEVFILGSMTISQGGNLRLLINGSERWIETPQSGTLAAKGYVQVLGPGTHFIRLIHSNSANTNGGSLYVLATKR